MERERITISIKKNILSGIDKTIDGINVRNRSHAIETLITRAMDNPITHDAVILLGGDNALKLIPNTIEILLSFKKLGLKKVYIAVGYLADKIKERIGNENDYGLKIQYVEGSGSGGAISSLKKHFKNTFLVIDPEFKLIEQLEKFAEYHRSHNGIATIFTGDLMECNGLYVFEQEVFKYIPNGFSMLKDDIFPKLIGDGKLVVYPVIK